MEERGYRGGGCPFDDQLAAFHDPDHGVEDLAVGEGYDLVDEALDDGEVDLAGAADAQAVDDGLAIDRLEMACFDALLHGRAVGRFDADHADLWIVTLGR